MRISIYRRAHFNAAHRLHNPRWSDEKNIEVFGLCNSPNFHGHNYDLEVRLTGEIDPDTGYLFDLGVLAKIIKQHIENRFDHKNLNVDIPEFKDKNPTTEYFAHLIWTILREHIEEKYEIGVKLWETPRNYVEFPAR